VKEATKSKKLEFLHAGKTKQRQTKKSVKLSKPNKPKKP
jgi:hypothetical protein